MEQIDPGMAQVVEDRLIDALATRLAGCWNGPVTITDLRPLAGGASRQLFGFVAVDGAGTAHHLVLRRDPPGNAEAAAPIIGPSRTGEAALLDAAWRAGVPVPRVVATLPPGDGLGEGYVMSALAGETIARRILREPALEAARARLAADCGDALARIHAIGLEGLPAMPLLGAGEQIVLYGGLIANWPEPLPIFDYALRWLDRNRRPLAEPTLVHGDFRNGNLVVGPQGLAGILDWELAHLGDPMEDLGWLCARSWRFGAVDRPVGGFGVRSDLFAAYEAAGGHAVDRERVFYWEVFAALRWGVMCLMQAERHLSGAESSLELLAIGRRRVETEHDLLELLEHAA